MRFEEALKAMREGKKVKRECWETGSLYTLANGVGIFDKYGTRAFMIKENDILAEDWEIADEWRALENEKYKYNNIYHTKDIEVLAPVPSYDEWKASENYIDYLKQCISVYESKEKQHTDDAIAYNELLEENEQLKSKLQLKETAYDFDTARLEEENAQLKEYERIVTSYNMKPIDYDMACETVNKLLDEKKDLKHRNENLQLALKTYELPEIQKVLIDWRTGELDRKFNKLEKENTKLKELLKECKTPLEVYNEMFGNKEELLAKIDEVLK